VWFRVPGVLLKAAMGQLATNLLLASVRMEPRALTRAGFTFDEPTPEALAAWVHNTATS